MKTIYFLLAIVSLSIFIFLKQTNELGSAEKSSPGLETSGALNALQLWNKQRAFPNEDIPPNKYFDEFTKSKKRFDNKDNINAPDNWVSIGPNNVGGRTLCITLNPRDTSIVWMGAASGGLWKSTTGGIGANAWTFIPTNGIPTLGVSCILIDSVNTNVMYIGTGETYNYQKALNGLSIRATRGTYGVGILKSLDGGISWFKSLDWTYQNNRGVWDIVNDPLNWNTLYAATTEGIYKSSDRGDSWVQIFTEKMVMDLAIDRINTNIIYAGVGNMGSVNPGLYRSTSSGITWSRLTSGLPTGNNGRTSVDTYYKNPRIVMASIGNDSNTVGLYLSIDQGNSWSQVSGTTDFLLYQGWYAGGLQIKNDDSSEVLVDGVLIYKSTNYGKDLMMKNIGSPYDGFVPAGGPEGPPNYMHGDLHYIISNRLNTNKVYIATDGGLFRSNDFGETFYGCNGGYVTTQFYGGFTNSLTDSNLALGGLQDNYSVRYNGTTTWYKTSNGDGTNTAINPTNQNIMFTGYTNQFIFRSTNGGNTGTWSQVFYGTPANFVAPYIMCPSNPNVMYAGTNKIYKSTTGGVSGSWLSVSSVLDGNLILSLAVSWTSTDTLYCATVPTQSIPMGFFRSINGGINWTNISTGLPNRYPTRIAVNPRLSKEVYSVFSGFGTPHVYKSTNSGDTWTNISGVLPDVPCQSIVVDPIFSNYVYLGNDFGVYVSSDAGTSWTSFTDGMPPAAMVFDVTISSSNRKVRAVTHGNGVYERSLLGTPIGITPLSNNVPDKFLLYQNYPNPFNPTTKIKFAIPSGVNGQSSIVNLKIYNILGSKVATLVNEQLQPGTYERDWDASNYPSGVYYYRMSIMNSESSMVFEETKKMVLVK